MKRFRAPKESLGNLDPEVAADLATAAADLALILDQDGTIKDLAFDPDEFQGHGLESWVGQPWRDVVTVESQPKVGALLGDGAKGARPRWRHLNHPIPGHADLPILYTTMAVGSSNRVVALGRDLRATATLQQQLVEAQQAMEHDYLRMRNVETRYRLIFQTARDAIVMVDPTSGKVTDANPAAGNLFGVSVRKLLGRELLGTFDDASQPGLRALLAEAEASGHGRSAPGTLAGGRRVEASASLLRQEGQAVLLVWLATLPDGTPANAAEQTRGQLLDVIENAPDAFVLIDHLGLILFANRAFLELTRLASVRQAEGQSLERWFGAAGFDLSVILNNLREHGSVRLFSTLIRSDFGPASKVEVSAVAIGASPNHGFGFLIRDVGRRLAGESSPSKPLPRSVEELTELVGQVPLKELVRATTDVIERLSIEAALELTGDNRASAAEMLGLSRQSLYVKLRRYGLIDLTTDEGA